MSFSINKIILAGRVGNAPEIRTLNDGTKVGTFSLATSKGGYKTKDGRDIPEVTQWHNIVVWRGNATVAEKAITKGSIVTVVGEMTYRTYKDKNGVERKVSEVVADEVVPSPSRKEEGQTTQQPYTQQAPPQYGNGYPQQTAQPTPPSSPFGQPTNDMPF